MFQKYSLSAVLLCLLASSCTNNANKPKHRGAIVFGDSNTIVTEHDEQYLTNNVRDLAPIAVAQIDTPKTSVPTQKDTVAIAQKPVGKGLAAPFKSLGIFINDVEGRIGKSADWAKDRSAAFTLTEGNLNNKTLRIDAAKVTNVEMRYQTVLLIEMPDGDKVEIEDMPSSLSDWTTQKGTNGNYAITGLSPKQLKYDTKIATKSLQNAVQKLARKRRMSRSDEKKLVNSVRKVRNANQDPVSIGLSTVVWKVDAKDASGHNMHRELRIDLHP